MLQQSLRNKIIVPTVLVLIVLVITLTAFSLTKFSAFTDSLFREKTAVTINALKNYLRSIEDVSQIAGISISTDKDVIEAIKKRDRNEIIRVLTPILERHHIDFCTVSDEEGIVLTRTHAPYDFGDSILSRQSVLDALDGKISTYYEEGHVAKVIIGTGVPVYDKTKKLLGVVSIGTRLDSQQSVENLKKHFKADFSVFFGDIRVATTVVINGKNIIGLRLDPAIAKVVIGSKKEYIGNSDVLNESHSAYYMPLINPQGEVFAVLSVGHSITHLIAEKRAIIISGILIGLLGLIVSVIVLSFIISKTIKPVRQLANIVSRITNGDMNVDTNRDDVPKDEIGALILDVYKLIDIIQSAANDLVQLTCKLNIYSDVQFQIDLSKYRGAYREIISSVKILTDSISMMKKTMAIVDYQDTMISVTDLDYNLLYINRSMENRFGIKRENCVGQKCYKAIRQFDAPCHFCQLPALLPEKDSFPSIEYSYVWDDVSCTWLGGRAAIMRWVDGGQVFLNSINDETTKKGQEEQLREAVELANVALAAKSAFLANTSHELRTPLNVIIGLTNLLLEDDHLPHGTRESIHKISNAGDILLNMVNDILDISKIESGHFTLTPVEYYMASLLNDTIVLNISRIDEKPIMFRLNIGGDLPYKLYGDDLRVKQILNNLLSNATKYTDKGFIELSVRCVRGGDKDVWMDISVSDTGIGIRKEDIKKLFHDYHQVDARANRKVEGTGLGLAITRKLVESMDGTIFVESEYGCGSIFHVRIKQGFVDDTQIGETVAENLRSYHYSEHKRKFSQNLVRADLSYAKVLIVDDVQTNLDVAAGIMRKYKMQVDCVTNGQSAIEKIKLGEPKYNAIFMDHMMPEMDGIETADKIRELATDYARTIPIIALTANAVVGTEELFYKHGFQAFITKPIDILKLDSVIHKWIKNKQDYAT